MFNLLAHSQNFSLTPRTVIVCNSQPYSQFKRVFVRYMHYSFVWIQYKVKTKQVQNKELYPAPYSSDYEIP